MNAYSRYLAFVLELPAVMLLLAYVFDQFDGPQHRMGGNGGLIGLVLSVVLWLVHMMWLVKSSEKD